MMTAQPLPIEDGNLPAARHQLDIAISNLIDPKPQTTPDGHIHWLDSLYQQLIEEIPGQQGTGHGVPRSIPPLCLDAAALLTEIDTAITCWEPNWPIPLPSINPWAYEDDHPTVLRIRQLSTRKWRPQDTHSIQQIANNIQSWCSGIKAILTPTRRWALPNPCPACNTATVHRKDSAGETVRQPALQIGPNGCECQCCHHKWAPEYFQHLANVLGYKLPEGVLE